MKSHPIDFHCIDHLTLIVADLEATRRFYCDVLGMVEVDRPAFDYAGKWFHVPGGENVPMAQALIHATLESESAGRAGWGDQNVGRLSRGHHFAFQISNALAACDFLAARGIDIQSGPKQRPDGLVQIFIQDPDGHVIELFSR